MLILAGITINIVMNGGLFKQAQDAKDKTVLTRIKDELGIELAEMMISEVEVGKKYTNEEIKAMLENKGYMVEIEERTIKSRKRGLCIYSKRPKNRRRTRTKQHEHKYRIPNRKNRTNSTSKNNSK
jgi:hypothetical protein